MKQNKKTLYTLLKRNKSAVTVLSVFVFTVFISFTIPEPVYAGGFFSDQFSSLASSIVTALVALISSILDGVINVLGQLLQLLVDGLKWVASYGQKNQFAGQQEVILGWQIVRDVINSFYIVVMIAIAIATILRYQPFHFKQALPRLILSAILVNFSRTLCLLAINFSTSVMAVFLTAINNSWPAFILGLRAPSFTALNPQSIAGVFGFESKSAVATQAASQGFTDTVLTSILAIVLQMIAIVFLLATAAAIAAYLIYLVVRVIMLWLLMIISPIAFFAWGTPGPKAKGQWGAWVQEFIKYVMAGPLLLFFIYIEIMFMVNNTKLNYGFEISGAGSGGLSLILAPKIFIGYVVGMVLLLMGFEQTQKMSLRGGQFASKFDPNKVLNGAKNLALKSGESLNNYLYSKGLSVKPVAAWQGIKAGLAARDSEYINQGNIKWSNRTAALDKDNKRFAALLTAAAGGNSKFFEDAGLVGLNRRSVLGRVLGGTSTYIGQPIGTAGAFVGGKIAEGARAIDDRTGNRISGAVAGAGQIASTAAEAIAESIPQGLKDTVRNSSIYQATAGAVGVGADAGKALLKHGSGYSVLQAVLGDSLGPSRELNQAYTALDDSRNQLKAADGMHSILKDDSKLRGVRDRSMDEIQAAAQAFSLEEQIAKTTDAAQLEALNGDLESVLGRVGGQERLDELRGSQSDIQEFAELAQQAYTTDQLAGVSSASLEAMGDTLNGDAASRKDRMGKITFEMRSRLQAANISGQQVRAGRARILQKVKDELYPKGTNVEVEQIYINSQADANPQSRENWKAHAIQAAEGGDVNDFYGKHSPDFTYDVDGIQKIHQYHQETLGMSDEESKEFIDQLNSIVKANRQVAMTGLTTSNDLGQIQFTSRAEQQQEVKKEWLKKSIDVLMKGGRAGQGTRQPDGSWQLHKGVVEAATANPQAFFDQWNSSWARNSSDPRVAKMWVDSGELDAIKAAAVASGMSERKAENALQKVRSRAQGA